VGGKSGQVILPGFGKTLAFLRGLPHWYQVGLRAKGENIMTKWKGRQVIDVDKWKSNGEKEGSESA
jgi:all-trans-retinol dehydrogenase (NAD+)